MKCKLKLINDNWYAENLGESGCLDSYNFLYTGDLYKVHHNSPRLLEDGKEVECEFVTEFTNPELYKDIPWGEGETYVRVVSLARQILKETPPEVRDRVKANALLEQNLGSRINTLQALFDRFIEKLKEQPADQAFEMTQPIIDELIKQLQCK